MKDAPRSNDWRQARLDFHGMFQASDVAHPFAGRRLYWTTRFFSYAEEPPQYVDGDQWFTVLGVNGDYAICEPVDDKRPDGWPYRLHLERITEGNDGALEYREEVIALPARSA